MSNQNVASNQDLNSSYQNPLGYERLSKLLIKFAVPAIIGMTINALYNVVDRIFIGNAPRLGANGIAGITICFPAMIIMMAIGILYGQGGATLFSISLGRGEIKKADKVLGNAFSLSIISSIVLMVIGLLFLDKLLVIFGASSAVFPYAKEYMSIILLGTLFQVISMCMNNFLRADGKPTLSMVTMFIGAGTNIVLDPILIYGLDMGMSGAALATITSQFISMVWSTYHFVSKKSVHRITLESMKLDKKIALNIVSFGMPGFLLQIANSVLNFILNTYLLRYGGDIAISGMGIVNSLQTLLILPMIGLMQGLQPIISFNYGAKKYDRVKKATNITMAVATIISVAGFLVSHLAPELLVSMFNRDEELMKFTVYALRSWLMMLPIVGFQIIGANFFQAIGKPKMAMVLTLLRQVIVLIPSIIIFSSIWGLNGIVHAAPFADFVSASVTSFFYLRFMKGFVSKKKLAESL